MEQTTTLSWKTISDESVRHVWKKVCTCNEEGADIPDCVEVNPDSYQNAGIPICELCGEDFEYVRTEVLQ